ncbi:hypothetical protein AHAS_Ahas06G0167700 [Arachis hypogaea]
MNYATSLSKDLGTPFSDSFVYRRLVEKLFYLTNTRLDLSFSVGCLSQFMDCLLMCILGLLIEFCSTSNNSLLQAFHSLPLTVLNYRGYMDSD